MLKLTRIFLIAICTIWTTFSSASSFEETYEVTVLDFGGLGWFSVQYAGEEYNLWFYWETFDFEQLDKIRHRFPMTATISITEDGQFLNLDKSIRGLVSGTQVIDKVFRECWESGERDEICASAHLDRLMYQRNGLLTYLKNQKMEPELLRIIDKIEKSQNISLKIQREMLDYIKDNRNRGTRELSEYYYSQFKIVEGHLDQLDFLLDAYE